MASWVKALDSRIRRMLVKIPLVAWLGLATQPHYEAPGGLQVKQVSIHSD